MTIELTRRLELLGADISRELALTLDEMIARLEVLEAERRADAAERRRLRAQVQGLAEHNEVLHRQVSDLTVRLRNLEADARSVPVMTELVQSGPFDPRD